MTLDNFIIVKNNKTAGAYFDFDKSKLPSELQEKVTVTLNIESYDTYKNPCIGLNVRNTTNDPDRDWKYYNNSIDVKINGVS